MTCLYVRFTLGWVCKLHICFNAIRETLYDIGFVVGGLGLPPGVVDRLESPQLFESASVNEQVLEYRPFFIWDCFDFYEKLEPPSSFVEAFGGEVDCMDWHLPRFFEVRNPSVKLG